MDIERMARKAIVNDLIEKTPAMVKQDIQMELLLEQIIELERTSELLLAEAERIARRFGCK